MSIVYQRHGVTVHHGDCLDVLATLPDASIDATVKPLALMRWLVRLVTPPGGTVLDPFLGSGTTAHAARAEGFACIGIEREADYLDLIRGRLDARPKQETPPEPTTSAVPFDLLDLLDGEAS